MRQLRLDCLIKQTSVQNILIRSYLLLFRVCDKYFDSVSSQDQRTKLKFILLDVTKVEYTVGPVHPLLTPRLVPRSFKREERPVTCRGCGQTIKRSLILDPPFPIQTA